MLELGSSERRLALGILLATAMHVLILSSDFALSERVDNKGIVLSVSLLKAPDEPLEELEPKPEKSNTTPTEPVQTAPPITPTAVNVISKKPAAETTPAEVRITTSVDSADFQRWLQTETDNFKANKPAAIIYFSQTFDVPPPTPSIDNSSPDEIRKSVKSGSTAYYIEKDGKRFCVGKILSLLSSDSQGSGSSGTVTADCTLPKKFDLRLDQPNNGWTNR